MTISIDLKPEVESALSAQAQLQGVSLPDYLRQIVTREAGLSLSTPLSRRPANLVELSEPYRGLLTDEEVDTLFGRNRSIARDIDLP